MDFEQSSRQVLEITQDQSGGSFIRVDGEAICYVDPEMRLALICWLSDAILNDDCCDHGDLLLNSITMLATAS